MLLTIKERATEEQIGQMAEDIDRYIKVVVDVEREILTGGGKRHFEGEQVLLDDGSKQSNLWGGGLDLETLEIDFDSMINVRPNQGNTSREVLSEDIRKRVVEIIRHLLK